MYLNTLRYIQFESNVHFSQLSNYQIHKFERKGKDHLTILFDRKISTKLKISIVFSSCLFHVMHNERVLYCFLSKIYLFFSFFLFFFVERSNIENIGKEINCGLPQEKHENTLVIC